MATIPLRIGLLWHSTQSPNFGVGALTVAHVALIREVAASSDVEIRVEIIGWAERTGLPAVVSDVDVVELSLLDFVPFAGKLYRAVRRCDLVLDIGAGDSFTDIYGVSPIRHTDPVETDRDRRTQTARPRSPDHRSVPKAVDAVAGYLRDEPVQDWSSREITRRRCRPSRSGWGRRSSKRPIVAMRLVRAADHVG
jgi:hypothetical protein